MGGGRAGCRTIALRETVFDTENSSFLINLHKYTQSICKHIYVSSQGLGDNKALEATKPILLFLGSFLGGSRVVALQGGSRILRPWSEGTRTLGIGPRIRNRGTGSRGGARAPRDRSLDPEKKSVNAYFRSGSGFTFLRRWWIPQNLWPRILCHSPSRRQIRT
jgi:hypothetical protein